MVASEFGVPATILESFRFWTFAKRWGSWTPSEALCAIYTPAFQCEGSSVFRISEGSQGPPVQSRECVAMSSTALEILFYVVSIPVFGFACVMVLVMSYERTQRSA
jgi:hypothetical protein